MKPQINDTQVGIYKFYWEDYAIGITVSRIKIHKDARVTGEILVEHKQAVIYPPTQLNFTSSRTLTTIINSLDKIDEKIDWSAIIRQLAFHILERCRMGEPVKELWTSDEIKPPEYLLYPILMKGIPTVIYGEKGVFKTGISQALAICLQLPWHDNPLGLIAPQEPVETLLLDWEAEEDIIKWQLKCLQGGMGLPPFALHYRRCALPLVDDIDQIQEHISKMGAKVIIVDSIAPAVGGDLKEASSALMFHNALRKLKVTSLLIGQTTKDDGKKLFGSVFFEYMSRSIWELRRVQEGEESEINLGLFHRNVNYSRLFQPMGFNVSFNGNCTSIKKQPVDLAQFIDSISAGMKIIEFLKDGAKTPKELSDLTGENYHAVYQALVRLGTKGKAVKVGEKWGLLADES